MDSFGIQVIIGPNTTERVNSAYTVAKDEGVLFISPAAMGYSLENLDGDEKSDDTPGRFWRTVGAGDQLADGLSSWVEVI